MPLCAARLEFLVLLSLRRSGEGQDSAYAGRDDVQLIGTPACRPAAPAQVVHRAPAALPSLATPGRHPFQKPRSSGSLSVFCFLFPVSRVSPQSPPPASRLLSSASIMVSWKLSSLLLLSLGALNAFAAIDVSSPRVRET